MLKNSISEKMPPQGVELPVAARSCWSLGDAVECCFCKFLKNSNLIPFSQNSSRALSSKLPTPLAPLPKRKGGLLLNLFFALERGPGG